MAYRKTKYNALNGWFSCTCTSHMQINVLERCMTVCLVQLSGYHNFVNCKSNFILKNK
jgi:hypothetical protein